MAELIIKKNGRQDLLFHAKVKNFKRVENLKCAGHHYKLFVNTNDSIYDIKEIINKDPLIIKRDTYLYNQIKGVPCSIAKEHIVQVLTFDSGR